MKKCLILVLALFVSSVHADVINAFTAEYKASDWAISANGGSAVFSDSDTILTIISDNSNQGSQSILTNTDALFNSAHADGTISFDWLYNTIDHPSLDYFGWLLNDNFTPLSDISNDAETRQLGSEAFVVEQGDIFGFRTVSTTSDGGSATTEISNFQFSPAEVPEPSTMAFFALVCIFIGLHRRKLAK